MLNESEANEREGSIVIRIIILSFRIVTLIEKGQIKICPFWDFAYGLYYFPFPFPLPSLPAKYAS